MTLVICPECGKEISNKSEKCINCGYPLINYICNINGVEYNLKNEFTMALVDNNHRLKAIGSLRKKTSLSLSDGIDLIDLIRDTRSVPNNFIPKYPLEDRSKYDNTSSNAITCPYCHSKNTNKISNLSKAGSVALFGIFSQKVKKQWHCNNCGSDF